MTNEQIEYFGKQAARVYLEEGIDLNKTITKLAEEHALNKYEIDRIVEASNTNTYLSMFSTADDKYIEFPVADSEKIAEFLNIRETETMVDDYIDYNDPPIFNIFPPDGVEKLSSVKDDIPSLNDYHRAKYAKVMLEEKLAIIEAKFETETERLYGMVKQAVLGSTRFGHIKVAMIQHHPGNITNIFIKNAAERLHNEDLRINISNNNENIKLGEVNKNNSLLKQLDNIYSIIDDATDIMQKYAGVIKGVYEIGKGLAKPLKYPFKGPKQFKKTIAGVAGLGLGTIVGTTAYKVGKDTEALEQSALKKIPRGYRK